MRYSKECKEEILSRFHASGMSMRSACSLLDRFPDARTLSAFLRDEEAGLLDPPPVVEVLGACADRKPWEPYP